MWLALALASASAQETVPPHHFQHVVFATLPSKKKRLKLIRKAMNKSEQITGGKDWGRVLCFVFQGEPTVGLLDEALERTRLPGVVRDADDCHTAPGEAYIPPDPVAVRRITLVEPTEPLLVRQALAFVMNDDNGISGLHVAPESSTFVCLELERKVRNDALYTLLETGSLHVESVTNARDCRDALGLNE